jgi:catechol 2,3-dioxygenase-like lactoylglutathione lyase family enzyme
MTMFSFQSTNTILYCQHWAETVAFYRDKLQLPVNFASDWFIEFRLSETARLSVANEQRASIKSSHGAGITLTFQVKDIEQSHRLLQENGLNPGPIRAHAWGARVCYFFDPEGHRLEMWA